MNTQHTLEAQLDDFDPAARQAALKTLIAEHGGKLPPAGTNLNMHLHSFFSYNAEGWSPSHLAWEARKAGLYAAGLCDFDVLDGLEEFLEAAARLDLRATVNLETRAFMRDYADVDLSSPGEPGVTYIMGAGFTRLPTAGSSQAEGLDGYRRRAQERNLALISRINPHVPEIAVDYEQDVLPLTPRGGATERHIIAAYVNKAAMACADVAAFWAKTLDKGAASTQALLDDRPSLEDAVRSTLAKRGGYGYEQPSEDTFPAVDDFIDWVRANGAIPMTTWLDGTSAGESDARGLLEYLRDKGAVALNIVPDRNWNVSDPAARATKIANLNAIVAGAVDLHLPVNIGTEMNKLGLPFVDDLAVEALRPHAETFTTGAQIMVGHTLLARYAALPYAGQAANDMFADVVAKNDFFAAVGALPPLSVALAEKLSDMGTDGSLSWFRSQV
jgi:hypothetical protein